MMIIFCLYSCNVYHTRPGTVGEAVESGDRVRVLTTENIAYEFRNFRQEGNHFVGVTGRNSDTAKLLKHRPFEAEGKKIRVKFEKEEILAVYLKNRKMSTLVNIGVPVVGAAGIIGVTSKDFKPDVN